MVEMKFGQRGLVELILGTLSNPSPISHRIYSTSWVLFTVIVRHNFKAYTHCPVRNCR